MRRIKAAFALLVSGILILSSCTTNQVDNTVHESVEETVQTPEVVEEVSDAVSDNTIVIPDDLDEEVISTPVELCTEFKGVLPETEFYGLNDEELLEYVEATVCSDISAQLGEGYYVEDVSAIYISQDYLDELAFNSQKNIYFGYSLEEVEEQFQGTKYVFTLGDDGTTEVIPFEEPDDSFNQIVKNVAIGTGVILICVTISAVSAGLGAPAVSIVFAASAKSAAEFAISTGVITTISNAAIIGYQTGDWEKAWKEAAVKGSESFKVGAITGSLIGGGGMFLTLARSTVSGLTMNEVAMILNEHGKLPVQFLKQIHSMDEYYQITEAASSAGISIEELALICAKTKYPIEIVKMFKSISEKDIYFDQAGLTASMVDGELALIRPIDLTFKSVRPDGSVVTNLDLMKMGYAPLDPLTGFPYELHHIGQTVDSPLAILTYAEHHLGGNFGVLHDSTITAGQGVHATMGTAWTTQKAAFWKAYAAMFG